MFFLSQPQAVGKFQAQNPFAFRRSGSQCSEFFALSPHLRLKGPRVSNFHAFCLSNPHPNIPGDPTLSDPSEYDRSGYVIRVDSDCRTTDDKRRRNVPGRPGRGHCSLDVGLFATFFNLIQPTPLYYAYNISCLIIKSRTAGSRTNFPGRF